MSRPSTNTNERLQRILDGLFPGATVSESARRLGIHVSTLGNYLSGARSPSFEFLVALAKHGVDVHWVVTGEGTPDAEGGADRNARIELATSEFSDIALLAEVDRRLHAAIEEAIELLKRVERMDLAPLAKKIRSVRGREGLTDDEIRLCHELNSAFWTIDSVGFWFPDLDPQRYAAFDQFVQLHERVTGEAAFRTIAYFDFSATVKSHSSPP